MQRLTIAERLLRRREVLSSGCWLWAGATNNNGYGVITITTPDKQRTQLVHRVAYETFVGAIPAGLSLDHLCRVPRCFNPQHLEPVTHAENMRRRLAPTGVSAANAAKTHCQHGHEFTPENTHVRPRGGGRTCRTCRAASSARQRRRRAESMAVSA